MEFALTDKQKSDVRNLISNNKILDAVMLLRREKGYSIRDARYAVNCLQQEMANNVVAGIRDSMSKGGADRE